MSAIIGHYREYQEENGFELNWTFGDCAGEQKERK
jgi:hypothetical protein